ncbi:hypothetical protein KM043_007276 [Ampulex compressa]|nr:hypothetical protein KM043_007276 [Ampulex compressa]
MGNYVYKYLLHDDEDEKNDATIQSPMENFSTDSNMCTPNMTERKLRPDPRSVTAGIDRTPIEVNSTPVGISKRISAIPKYLQTKKYLETDMDVIMPPLTPRKRVPVPTPNEENKSPAINVTKYPKTITDVHKERYEILGLDPRSPAADFDRTPILMPRSLASMRARSQESLHRRGSYEADIFSPRYSYCEVASSFNIPIIQALPDLASNVIKSLNIMDTVVDQKSNESGSSRSDSSSSIETISDSDEVTVIKNLEAEFTKPNIPISSEEMCDIENKIAALCKQNTHNFSPDQTNDKIKIWRDSMLSEDLKESKHAEDKYSDSQQKIPQNSKEEIIILFDDDNVTKPQQFALNTIKSESNKQRKVEEQKRKKKHFKAEMKIAVNDNKVSSPENKVGGEILKVRTPLGNRSNGRVQGISAKSPQQVLWNKSINTKVQQENTPPHKRCIAKSKLSGIHWDPDSTFII